MSQDRTSSGGFEAFVRERKGRTYGEGSERTYAYAADLAMLRTFERIKPIEMAASAAVRLFKELGRNELLGTTIRVGPTQFPRIHAIATRCAQTLDVAVPTVYVANDPRVNAYTFGTNDDAFIVIHSALVDHFTDDELTFVIGHETGHIQNRHVVYNTVLYMMQHMAGLFLPWIVAPAELTLRAWYRRAEITCDRAGLLCCGSVDSGGRAFLKMASGSKKLYEELNVDAYLQQLEDGRRGVGRFREMFATHPYLPKRVSALRVFAQSALYRRAVGVSEDGLPMDEVDRRTSEIIQVVGG